MCMVCILHKKWGRQRTYICKIHNPSLAIPKSINLWEIQASYKFSTNLFGVKPDQKFHKTIYNFYLSLLYYLCFQFRNINVFDYGMLHYLPLGILDNIADTLYYLFTVLPHRPPPKKTPNLNSEIHLDQRFWKGIIYLYIYLHTHKRSLEGFTGNLTLFPRKGMGWLGCTWWKGNFLLYIYLNLWNSESKWLYYLVKR